MPERRTFTTCRHELMSMPAGWHGALCAGAPGLSDSQPWDTALSSL